jgi:hypothetical protein
MAWIAPRAGDANEVRMARADTDDLLSWGTNCTKSDSSSRCCWMMLGYVGVMISETIAGSMLHGLNEENRGDKCSQPQLHLHGVTLAALG